ncbi:hypothetical protein MKP05_15735 [Halomonas sp. EGI 63088]|uniref:Uncharacterized protein n=1 Tax=Halomonas flagellata TaxID=2920385 RepID=A0ABS9RXL9_9GAMM|nr:hypothetical protein [Halomonas flagellata]MCH4564554.1 hypothetical protein [Halomonas flagellata]
MDRHSTNEKGKAVKTFTGMKGRVGTGTLAILLVSLAGSGTVLAETDLKADALSAAWPGMQEGARVVDWEGNVLQEGSNGFTCMPTPPVLSGTAPMCLDELWMEWAQAWQNKEPFTAESIGVAYMLSGDEGASNVDPYAEGPTDDNEWIKEGPHLMLIAPAELLENFPTDPHSGGPYVMWQGTDYQHLMIPVAARE